MCAAPPAARRQIRIGAGREGEQGRDQLDAEEEQENDAKKTSHREIVAAPRYFFLTPRYFFLTSPKKRVIGNRCPASKMTTGPCLWPVQLRKREPGTSSMPWNAPARRRLATSEILRSVSGFRNPVGMAFNKTAASVTLARSLSPRRYCSTVQKLDYRQAYIERERKAGYLNPDSLDLIERDLVVSTIIEAGRTR